MLYYNNNKIKELWYQGKKIKEAWYQGSKVYSISEEPQLQWTVSLDVKNNSNVITAPAKGGTYSSITVTGDLVNNDGSVFRSNYSLKINFTTVTVPSLSTTLKESTSQYKKINTSFKAVLNGYDFNIPVEVIINLAKNVVTTTKKKYYSSPQAKVLDSSGATISKNADGLYIATYSSNYYYLGASTTCLMYEIYSSEAKQYYKSDGTTKGTSSDSWTEPLENTLYALEILDDTVSKAMLTIGNYVTGSGALKNTTAISIAEQNYNTGSRVGIIYIKEKVTQPGTAKSLATITINLEGRGSAPKSEEEKIKDKIYAYWNGTAFTVVNESATDVYYTFNIPNPSGASGTVPVGSWSKLNSNNTAGAPSNATDFRFKVGTDSTTPLAFYVKDKTLYQLVVGATACNLGGAKDSENSVSVKSQIITKKEDWKDDPLLWKVSVASNVTSWLKAETDFTNNKVKFIALENNTTGVARDGKATITSLKDSNLTKVITVTQAIKPADPTYTIKWYPNGGTWTDGTEDYKTQSNVPLNGSAKYGLPGTAPTRKGYYLTSWNTNSSGTGTTIVPGTTTFSDASKLEVYAIWEKKADAFTMTWNPNGGTFTNSIYKDYADLNGGVYKNTKDLISKTTFTIINGASISRSGRSLLGWADSSTATTPLYVDGVTYNYTWGDDHTVYAIWSSEIAPTKSIDSERYVIKSSNSKYLIADGSNPILGDSPIKGVNTEYEVIPDELIGTGVVDDIVEEFNQEPVWDITYNSSDKSYTIKNVSHNTYLGVNSSGLPTLSSTASKLIITGSDSHYSIYDFTNKYKLTSNTFNFIKVNVTVSEFVNIFNSLRDKLGTSSNIRTKQEYGIEVCRHLFYNRYSTLSGLLVASSIYSNNKFSVLASYLPEYYYLEKIILSNGDTLDLPHFVYVIVCLVIDGGLTFISKSNFINNNFLDSNQDVSSWGGDLATYIKDLINNPALSFPAASFGYEDLISDFDGILIAKNFMTNDLEIGLAINSYYSGLTHKTRCLYFIDGSRYKALIYQRFKNSKDFQKIKAALIPTATDDQIKKAADKMQAYLEGVIETPITYEIRWYTNGGSWDGVTDYKVLNSVINNYSTYSKPSSASLTRSGYEFKGWNTLSDGNGTDITSGSTLIKNVLSLDVYAKWEASSAPTEYTMTWNPQGGVFDSAYSSNIDASTGYFVNKKTYGLSFTTFNASLCIKSGYVLIGWDTNPNATTPSYGLGVPYTYNWTTNKTIYAIWEKDETSVNPVTWIKTTTSGGEFNSFILNNTSNTMYIKVKPTLDSPYGVTATIASNGYYRSTSPVVGVLYSADNSTWTLVTANDSLIYYTVPNSSAGQIIVNNNSTKDIIVKYTPGVGPNSGKEQTTTVIAGNTMLTSYVILDNLVRFAFDADEGYCIMYLKS